MKWQTDEWKEWYFEEQTSSGVWIEHANGDKIVAQFILISLERDYNGYPIAILENTFGKYSVVLVQGRLALFNSNRTAIEKVFATGYWSKKYSKYFQIN